MQQPTDMEQTQDGQTGGEQDGQEQGDDAQEPPQQEGGEEGQAEGGGGDADNNNDSSNGGDQTHRGTQIETPPPATPTLSGEQTPAQSNTAGADTNQSTCLTPIKRANELEGLDIERGEDEVPDLETARGHHPVEFKELPKPERGDDRGYLKEAAPAFQGAISKARRQR
ncbi:hypothetical protein V1264_013457 [Littorina saxatilis]|uniref:Uncharacterized protein n=1 Tax=Littorina saxatilis TaxID=31220 RepID=A0AAN9BQP8_9CAEN